MPNNAYEEINHTADIALRVWGKDFYGLLRHAAEGMYDLMGIASIARSQVENSFRIVLDTSESMLVDFLNECLYLVEDKNQAFDSFNFFEEDGKLRVDATGVEVRTFERQIKAVTFHKLDIAETTSGLEAIITFDV
jgi:SHS2 domain-containing protein